MSRSFSLTIAGLRLQVSSDQDEYALLGAYPFYAPFVDRVDCEADACCDLTILHAAAPERSPGDVLLFDASPCWELWSRPNGGLRMVRRPDHPGHDLSPLWIADCDAGCKAITLYRLAIPIDRSAITYPLDQFLLVQQLASLSGVLLHAACVKIDGKAYVFAGRSGAGKTTISRLFAADPRIEILSDDRCVVRLCQGVPRVFGTPWPGEGGYAQYGGAPLAGMFILEKTDTLTRIEPFDSGSVFDHLAPVASIPWYQEEQVGAYLRACSALLEQVPVERIRFQRSGDVVRALDDHIARAPQVAT